jgi:hypothetical protein
MRLVDRAFVFLCRGIVVGAESDLAEDPRDDQENDDDYEGHQAQ